MSFSLGLDLEAFNAGLDEMAAATETAARPAAQAIAQVLVDQVKANVARIPMKTGRLAASIYQVYSKDNSTPVHAVYHVSWNAKKAPHGHLVEFGHVQRFQVYWSQKRGRFFTRKDRPLPTPIQIPAHPFVRPAQAAFERAQQAGIDRYYQALAFLGYFR